MRTVTIEIDQEKDLFVVEEFSDDLGLKYRLDDTEAIEKSILTGYDQSKKGLTRPHAKIMQEFLEKFN